jgi:hypothetical protein
VWKGGKVGVGDANSKAPRRGRKAKGNLWKGGALRCGAVRGGRVAGAGAGGVGAPRRDAIRGCRMMMSLVFRQAAAGASAVPHLVRDSTPPPRGQRNVSRTRTSGGCLLAAAIGVAIGGYGYGYARLACARTRGRARTKPGALRVRPVRTESVVRQTHAKFFLVVYQ